MPLVSFPSFALNSQYRPNLFVLSMTSANPLVLAQASIVVDGIGVTSMSKQPLFNIGTTYYFAFDVSNILQQYSAPSAKQKTSIFPNTLNTVFNQPNPDLHTFVGLIVSYYYNSPATGLLEQFATIDTVPFGYYAIAATRQTKDWQNMGLNDYIMDTFLGAKKYLTNFPHFGTDGINYDICPDENHYLTFVPYLCNSFRVTTIDGAGATIQQGLASIAPDSTLIPTTIGSGMVNLASQTYFSGAVNINNPNIVRYIIEIGQSFLFGSSWFFNNSSMNYVFKVNRDCCKERKTRLHWINRLGGADSFTFAARKAISEKNKSNIAQKPQAWDVGVTPITSHDKGRFKIQTEAVTEYEIESTFYQKNVGEWIAEILTSPEVYMETDYGLVAVIVTDAAIKTSENDELLNIVLTIQEANNISLQTV